MGMSSYLQEMWYGAIIISKHVKADLGLRVKSDWRTDIKLLIK